MNDASIDPKEVAFSRFMVAHASLRAAISERMELKAKLPLEFYEVLVILEGEPDSSIRLSTLADRAALSRSGLTRRLDRMERYGLVKREQCEGDRRGADAVLTEEGAEALEAAKPAYASAVEALFGSRLTTGEAKQLAAVMNRIIEPLRSNS